ncbi:hypothetical protein STTU_3680 [Streptomyces sp. Tu6071]|nr:hypothetical protein STTU_3680 [Streptomyces sp. Tu6071]
MESGGGAGDLTRQARRRDVRAPAHPAEFIDREQVRGAPESRADLLREARFSGAAGAVEENHLCVHRSAR